MPAMRRKLVSKRVVVTLAIALVASLAAGSWQIAAASNYGATQPQGCATAEPAPDGGDIGAQSQVCTSPESPGDADAVVAFFTEGRRIAAGKNARRG